MEEALKERLERTLILCVDRDDDLGVKAGMKTPVLGRRGNLDAAVSLALRDPEEPDANAIFEAVRLYDRLNEGVGTQGEYQIATITGSELGGVGADRKLVSELTEVLEAFHATDVILVTDGYSDEAVLPLVQSRVPVTSVRRIVVKHSESIEETAAIFSRYFKTLLESPRYSRVVLGLPGILLIIFGFLSMFNLLAHAWIAILIIFGSLLSIKGFGLDRMARNLYTWVREYSLPPMPAQIAGFSTVAGALLIAVGFYQGWYQASAYVTQPGNFPADIGQWVTVLPRLLAEFISESIALTVLGICVLLSGRAIRWYFERDSKLLRTIVIVAVVAWSSQIFSQASRILREPAYEWFGLAFSILIGMLLAVAMTLITYFVHWKYGDLFREKEAKEFTQG